MKLNEGYSYRILEIQRSYDNDIAYYRKIGDIVTADKLEAEKKKELAIYKS